MGFSGFIATQHFEQQEREKGAKDTGAILKAEWLENVKSTMQNLVKVGIHPVKVEIDVEELLQWCLAQNLPVNSSARASFTAQKVSENRSS